MLSKQISAFHFTYYTPKELRNNGSQRAASEFNVIPHLYLTQCFTCAKSYLCISKRLKRQLMGDMNSLKIHHC